MKKNKKTKNKKNMLVVDVRESDLISCFPKDKVEISQMPIGDVLITTKEGCRILVERKTVSDLISSIKDGRYRNQKARMMDALSASDVDALLYIIEQDSGFPKRRKAADEKIFCGALSSLALIHKIPVIHSSDVEDTARWCSLLENKKGISKNQEEDFLESETSSSGIHHRKYKKSAGLTPELCFLSQLVQIPGISEKIGSEITKKWTSMMNMCRSEDFSVASLQSLPGIGRKKAETIWKYCGGC